MAETKKPSHAQKAAGAKRKAGAEKKDKSTPKPEKNGGEPKFRLPIRFITSCSFLLAFIVSTIMLLRRDRLSPESGDRASAPPHRPAAKA